jgi:hypothetical protein
MGYFQRMGNMHFKLDYKGRTIFYLWARFGKGFIIESDHQEAKIRSFLTMLNATFMILFLLLIATIGPIFGIVLLPIYYIVMTIGFKIFTKGLTPSTTKLVIPKYE